MASTSINMHRNVFQIITDTAERLGKSRRDIVVYLLMRIMRDHDDLRGEFKMVRYQKKDKKENWHCFKIRFKQDEYEFFIDLRKVCKCSVSLLVARAVERYVEELINKKAGKKIVGNYVLFKHYTLRRVIVEGIICWQLYWGFPKKHLEIQRL